MDEASPLLLQRWKHPFPGASFLLRFWASRTNLAFGRLKRHCTTSTATSLHATLLFSALSLKPQTSKDAMSSTNTRYLTLAVPTLTSSLPFYTQRKRVSPLYSYPTKPVDQRLPPPYPKEHGAVDVDAPSLGEMGLREYQAPRHRQAHCTCRSHRQDRPWTPIRHR